MSPPESVPGSVARVPAVRTALAGITAFGLATLLGGGAALVLGLLLHWVALDLLGLGLLLVLALAFGSVARPSRLVIDREIQPPRVAKGSPAIALVTFANRSRRAHPVLVATQPFGGRRVRTVIPRLRAGESGSRAYRLPTERRGIYDVPPLETSRRDPYELFRVSHQHAGTERIWVYPRILPFGLLPAGRTPRQEGPTTESSAHGITFHRLREYVAGDDLRQVHWRSSARAGTLLVRHNVDTAQPYTVVLLDLRPALYTEALFEHAVDVAASVLVAGSADRAPVQLRLTDSTALGGPRCRDATPLIDHLTGVTATVTGSLQTALSQLSRSRGASSLVVVTGELDPADLPRLSALRQRFERLVLISIDPQQQPVPRPTGVRVIVAADAGSACAAWNRAGTP